MGQVSEINDEAIMPALRLIEQMREPENSIMKMPSALGEVREVVERNKITGLAKSLSAAEEAAETVKKQYLDMLQQCENYLTVTKAELEDMGVEIS